MPVDLTLVQAITLAIAVVGAVLGIINTWHSLDKSRVKLVVRPAHAIPLGGSDTRIQFSIEVTNLSEFPVTVDDVGVLYEGTNVRGGIVRPILMDGGQWPRRLESRSSVTVYSYRPESTAERRIKCAYAATQCGHTEVGTSAALEQIAMGTV